MQDYELPAKFYLGREYDPAAGKPKTDLVLYDAKDLCTHAVCVGMTGSGKTGLCLDLLEEAAIDGIPAIMIDPKGDIGNLLLTFPELRPADFQPWIDPGEATRKGKPLETLAAETAESWKKGLADWGQTPERIQKFKDAVDITIYTPGGSAGVPLTVLKSFAAPSEKIRNNNEALREKVAGAVSGLLALMNIDADPLQSREHILLCSLVDAAWRAGRDLDLTDLIRDIQKPPFDKVGVLDLDSFYPQKDRFALSMALNNLLASPGFQNWMQGEPLDIQRLFYSPEGKPRFAIISIAHLGDSERMFFVTLLLNELIAWMRTQSGTTSLRALFYMDEVFGYFPPSANPPSKIPMLTLLKQARAFGLGCMLATQNPVDLDYKGLSNAGTWFLGRLQTERDKLRVLDGLEGASTAAGAKFDRGAMEKILSGLGNRVFLMNNVHEDHPVVFQSRWALSFLRGPLDATQIRTLMDEKKSAQPAATKAAGPKSGGRPLTPPGIEEVFLPRRAAKPAGCTIEYRPGLLADGKLHFQSTANKIDEWDDILLLADAAGGVPGEEAWENATTFDEKPDFESGPEEGATYADLPGALAKAKSYADFAADVKATLYRTKSLDLFKYAKPKLAAERGESEGDFRIRVAQSLREQRDADVEKLKAKYAVKYAALQERMRKAEQRVVKEKEQANQGKFQVLLNIGTTVLGGILGGRKSISATKISTTARSASRAFGQHQEVGQAEENTEAVAAQMQAMVQQFNVEVAQIDASIQPDKIAVETLTVKLKKTDIAINAVKLAWIPYVVNAEGMCKSAV
ncbi:MAG: ATP-binding protein [Pirellulales bacterium]